MRKIGLHIRIFDTLLNAVEKAHRLNLNHFQCFLINQTTGSLIHPTPQEAQEIADALKRYSLTAYLHSSYYINVAGDHPLTPRTFGKEIAQADRMGFSHIVVHAGSVPKATDRRQGIDNLARTLNKAFKNETQVKCMLENTAQEGSAIGSDLHDFKLLLEKIDEPEKFQLCIDTAHAHSYGYPLMSSQERDTFIDLIDQTVGIDRVALLHVNDTTEKLGSRVDRHAAIGQGVIGAQALIAFMQHPRLSNIPVLLELPPMPEEEEVSIVTMVRQSIASEKGDL